jgi:hypothetical protein
MATMEIGFLLVLLGAALLRPSRARGAAALAAASVGIALAGLRAGPSSTTALDRAAVAGLPAGFVAVDAGLVALGVVLGAWSAVLALRGPRLGGAAAAAAVAAGVAGQAWAGRALLAGAPIRLVVVAMVAIASVGLLLLLVGRFLRLPPGRDESEAARPLAGAAGLLAGALVAAAGPHVAFVFAGVILGVWSSHLQRRSAGGPTVPVAPLLALLLLPAWWLMATIAGGEGLRIAAVGSLPFSPAAERILAPLILAAAWGTAGLWPLHRQVPGALAAPLGALLLARVAIPAVPDGLELWRPLAMPLVVVGIWHAALGGRRAAMAVGLAWVGLLAATRPGLLGAGLLLAGAVAIQLLGGRDDALPRPTAVARFLSLLAMGWGALLAVAAGLGAEVVYTVLAAAGLVAALGRRNGAQAMTASARSATPPSA